MAEKRFHSEDNCVGYYTEIIDEQKELDFSIPNPKKNLTIEELVELLNNIYEENQWLKQQLQNGVCDTDWRDNLKERLEDLR